MNFFFTDTKLASTRRDSKKRSSHACVTFVDNSNSPSGTFQVRAHLFHYIITHCPHCLSSHWPIPYRRGSTPVSTVLRKSVRVFTINIFNNKITIIELSKLKSGKQSGQMFSFSSFRALDRNPRKGTLGTLKIKKNSRGLP